ncbi:hypothetical protein F0562_004188 [Nyssa sinensis]|uniref:S-adenosylmethionine-dependent methyltransferase n=1 Tax=Nyssa sinensis TaxID=561372 RepID=A0A5J5BXW3_9ASTE|nr:hypothetical protein F0562_004188 [Nyssa sinensis]
MPETFSMNGGDGPHSYTKNSCYQREVVDAAKDMIIGAIAEKLDIENPTLNCSNPIRIADLGCSVGPNTFIAMQNIIEAVEHKYQSLQLQNPPRSSPEFQVFFNDHASNDFNTLFISLPPSGGRQYFAAGVPGSFHGRLFPRATLHIAHSSYALHWLSMVPEEVVDRNSPAWNKGKVHYTGNETVLEAYSAQYKRDMEVFLSARAQEIVSGGLLLLLIPGCHDGVLPSETGTSMLFGLFGSCLMDMAKMGMISEEKVDSFNLPLYHTSPHELKESIETNGYFNIERMDFFTPHTPPDSPDCEILALHLRAAIEGLITEHFGTDQIIEELFERYAKKMEENLFVFDVKYRKEFVIFACLKRKNN